MGRKVRRDVLLAILTMLVIGWVTFNKKSNTTSYILALLKEFDKDSGKDVLRAILAMPTRVGRFSTSH